MKIITTENYCQAPFNTDILMVKEIQMVIVQVVRIHLKASGDGTSPLDNDERFKSCCSIQRCYNTND